MELQALIVRIRDGETLTQDERQHMALKLEAELRVMREKDPKAYLSLLNVFIDAVKRCSSQLAA